MTARLHRRGARLARAPTARRTPPLFSSLRAARCALRALLPRQRVSPRTPHRTVARPERAGASHPALAGRVVAGRDGPARDPSGEQSPPCSAHRWTCPRCAWRARPDHGIVLGPFRPDPAHAHACPRPSRDPGSITPPRATSLAPRRCIGLARADATFSAQTESQTPGIRLGTFFRAWRGQHPGRRHVSDGFALGRYRDSGPGSRWTACGPLSGHRLFTRCHGKASRAAWIRPGSSPH